MFRPCYHWFTTNTTGSTMAKSPASPKGSAPAGKPAAARPRKPVTPSQVARLMVDTSAMTPEQVAQTAEAMLPKRKARHNVGDKVTKNTSKAAKTPGQDKKNVKSAKNTGKEQRLTAAGAPDKRVDNPGRPSDYNQETADRICSQLAEGKSMRTVCLAEDMPVMSTVFKWLREKKDFSEQYAKAKAESADALVEQMLDIADDGRNDTYEDADGNQRTDTDVIARSRLRVDTRKWIAAKLKPKKYGERVDMNHGVQPDNPLLSLLAQVNGTALPVIKDSED